MPIYDPDLAYMLAISIVSSAFSDTNRPATPQELTTNVQLFMLRLMTGKPESDT